ncbi:diacylglycerol kinase [Dictyobacter alpinus]|uniref:Diacylglycerol kinase n=1 Tax=Dictyobacter alpinus TaxID=2014873 RepID=A0A402BHW0_9CHLR|nr:diacylglycerol kinase family protein [Dictyobacter alpinus]GCE30837.1 diacylglycerol kinase [Dictyobacter alpinus]
MPIPQKAIVIHSPASGKSSRLAEATNGLRTAGLEIVETFPISALDKLPPQGRCWQERGIDLVVAAGGDGLIGGVTSHIVSSSLPMGILPLGTANDVARTVGIPMDIPKAVAVIASGKAMSMDIGIAEPAEQEPHHLADSNPTNADHPHSYFVHALTIGLNVKFAKFATDKKMRKKFGNLTYAAAVARALQSYTPIDVELRFEGLALYEHEVNGKPIGKPKVLDKPITIHSKIAQVAIVNSPVFWGALEATVPGVDLNDRLLDIVVIEDNRLEHLIFKILRFFGRRNAQKANPERWYAQFPELLAAERTNIAGIHHVQAQGIIIYAKDKRTDVTLDGEVRGVTPMHAHVANERLKIIVPA